MSGTGHRGRVVAAVLASFGLIAAVVLVGCGGSSEHGNTPGTTGTLLERTLAGVRDDPSVLIGFGFGDIATERSLAGVPPAYGAGHPAARWQRVLGFGADYFGEDPAGKRDGLDILTGSVAVNIGQPPHSGGLISGSLVDGSKVRMALQKLGAVTGTVAGQPGLTWGAEASQHLNALDEFGTGPGLGEFDRAIVTTHTVIAGRYTSEVATLAGGGARSAAADPTLAATSACLGDVVAAMGQRTTAGRASVELSVGVRRPRDAGAPAQEVLCVVPIGGSTAPTAAALCSRVGPHARMRFGGESPSRLDTAATPETGKASGTGWSGCVVTDRPAIPAGWLLEVFVHARAVGLLAAQ